MAESEGDNFRSHILSSVPLDWLDWVLGLFMRGVPSGDIVARCCKKGLAADTAKSLVEELLSNPLFDCLVRHLEAKAKAESLLRLLASLHSKRDEASGVARFPSLPKDRFFQDFVFANRPVILTDILGSLCGCRQWEPQALAAEFGSCSVHVSIGERWTRHPPYRRDFEQIEMSLASFVSRMLNGRESDSIYLTSEDRLFAREGFESLFHESLFNCEYLNHDMATPDTVKLWMGPPGTHTPMHHDRVNVLVAQLHGRKRFTLCSSAEFPRMGNDFGCYSSKSFDKEHRQRSADAIPRFVVELGPGDALFVPVGWWHDVVALDPSVTITYDNLDVDKGACSWLGVYWIRNCPGLNETSNRVPAEMAYTQNLYSCCAGHEFRSCV